MITKTFHSFHLSGWRTAIMIQKQPTPTKNHSQSHFQLNSTPYSLIPFHFNHATSHTHIVSNEIKLYSPCLAITKLFILAALSHIPLCFQTYLSLSFKPSRQQPNPARQSKNNASSSSLLCSLLLLPFPLPLLLLYFFGAAEEKQ